MASIVPQKHLLEWTETHNGETSTRRSREWKAAPYMAIPEHLEGGACDQQRKAIQVTSINVRYAGPAPINPDILTRQYRHVVHNSIGYTLWGFLCCPCYMLTCCFIENEQDYCLDTFCPNNCPPMQARMQKNADLYNDFVAKTLDEADKQVDARIAALSSNIIVVNTPSRSEEEALKARIAELEKARLQAENDLLKAQLVKAQHGLSSSSSTSTASITTPLLQK